MDVTPKELTIKTSYSCERVSLPHFRVLDFFG